MDDNKKLIIQPPKYKGETTVISMRMPKDMLVAIDKVVAETGRNRNEILMLSIDFALENMEIVKE
jgi:metal-responsive CopG/Arc/MetJ family transcriptional regulator